MPQLEARSTQDGNRNWCRPLPPKPVTIGRLTKTADWVVDWDSKVSGDSGCHATVTWQNNKLFVQRRMTPQPARNPIFFGGQPVNECQVGIGEQFVIGDTVFTVTDDAISPHRVERTQVEFSRERVQKMSYGDPNLHLKALSELPGMIRQLPSDDILEEMVINSLLRGVPRADGAAVVMLAPESTDEEPKVLVRCSIRRGADPDHSLHPSRRLVNNAVASRLSVLHIFDEDSAVDDASYTRRGPETEWAMCTPLLDESCVGWGLFLAGRLPREIKSEESVEKSPELNHDVKFAELVADLFSSIRQMRQLQSHVSQLERFLPRNLLTAVPREKLNEGLLDAKQTTVTVLFCDLRGSSRIAEQGKDDLAKLWDTVSEALGIMTSAIMENGGVVGDFQGDAAMGFWGWPLATPDQIEQAAKAALTIARKFAQYAQNPRHPLSGFACGVGLAHGPAIAGRIGTIDQFKIGVFGPVVNLAARLESMTKKFRVPILVDEAIAKHIRDARTGVRCRTLAKVVPAGMTQPLQVSELLHPKGEPGAMREPYLLDFEAAQAAFQKGQWDVARRKLTFADGPSELLKSFMARNPSGPPKDWDGVVPLEG
jgi:adenylate cyclase